MKPLAELDIKRKTKMPKTHKAEAEAQEEDKREKQRQKVDSW